MFTLTIADYRQKFEQTTTNYIGNRLTYDTFICYGIQFSHQDSLITFPSPKQVYQKVNLKTKQLN